MVSFDAKCWVSVFSKVTLDLHSNQEKFGGFLRATLDVLSQLLELATLHDISKVRVSHSFRLSH